MNRRVYKKRRRIDFPFPFQNVLESYLIGASMLLVLLGALYTFVEERLVIVEVDVVVAVAARRMGGI